MSTWELLCSEMLTELLLLESLKTVGFVRAESHGLIKTMKNLCLGGAKNTEIINNH